MCPSGLLMIPRYFCSNYRNSVLILTGSITKLVEVSKTWHEITTTGLSRVPGSSQKSLVLFNGLEWLFLYQQQQYCYYIFTFMCIYNTCYLAVGLASPLTFFLQNIFPSNHTYMKRCQFEQGLCQASKLHIYRTYIGVWETVLK